MTTEEKITEYGKTLDSTFPLDVDQLIESHKRQREILVDLRLKLNEQLQSARNEAYNDALQYAKDNLYMSVDQLRDMTIGELIEWMKGE